MNTVVSSQAKSVNRVFLMGFLAKQAGKFVSVDFVKQDGSSRSLNGRLGVKKFLKGGHNTTMTPARSYLTVYDMKHKGYRNVDMSTVNTVRAQGAVFNVVD